MCGICHEYVHYYIAPSITRKRLEYGLFLQCDDVSSNLCCCFVLSTVGVFVAVAIFQFSITMSFIIVIVLLMVDLEVYGFIYIIGAKLNCKYFS